MADRAEAVEALELGRARSARPMSWSWRTARGVSPSPQVFSRGNSLRSTTRTRCPSSASQYAAAAPDGSATDHDDVPALDGLALARYRSWAECSHTWSCDPRAARYALLRTSVVGNATTQATPARPRSQYVPRAARGAQSLGRKSGNAQPAARLVAVDPSGGSSHLGQPAHARRDRVRRRADQAAEADPTVLDAHRRGDLLHRAGRRLHHRDPHPRRRQHRELEARRDHRRPRPVDPDRARDVDGPQPQAARPRSGDDVGRGLRRCARRLRPHGARLRGRPPRVADVRELVPAVGRLDEVHLPQHRQDAVGPAVALPLRPQLSRRCATSSSR